MRRRTWAKVVERLALDTDLWIAARLDTRPLADVALDAAAWAGRVWRHAAATARHTLYGPGRGLLAVLITKPKETRDVR